MYIGMCFGVCLVILGLFGYMVSVKISEQNHRLTTMFELVNNIIQDMQVIKIQHTVDKLSIDRPVDKEQGLSELPTVDIFESTLSVKSDDVKKIVVSDVESISYGTDTEPDTDDDTDIDTDSDIDGDEDVVEDEDDKYTYDEPIKVLTVDYTPSHQVTDKVPVVYDIEDLSEDILLPSTEPYVEKVRTIVYDNIDETKEIKVEADFGHVIQVTLSDVDDIVQCTHTNVLEETVAQSVGKDDYGKMDISKLRKLVSEKSPETNTSKLKKKDLIKLLTE